MLAHQGGPELRLALAMTFDAMHVPDDWVKRSITSTKAIAGSAGDSVEDDEIVVGSVVRGLGASSVCAC